MNIRELTLSQFRVWTYRTFSLDPEVNVLIGPNASGKSSLLEAVRYLSTGRSYRSPRDGDCVQWGSSSFSLRGTFEGGGVDTIAVSYGSERSGQKKIARVDDEPLPRLSQLRGRFPVVLFSPDHLQLFKQGPERRRQFLNELLSLVHEDYIEQVRDYNRARNQRNELLKRPSPDEVLLESYEEKMAENARDIVIRRRRVLQRIEPHFREYAESLDFGNDLSIQYDPDLAERADFRREFVEERPRAMKRGYTTIGPQRDDWMVMREGRRVDRYGSQGELRALLISLKFAENSVIISCLGITPTLLLDDLESELDTTRRESCYQQIIHCRSQVIVTGTHPPTVDTHLHSKHFLELQSGS